MTRSKRKLVASLLAGAAASSAAAQEAGAPADIVVTAERRAESSQRVPISISVLPSSELAAERVKDLLQAAPLVPGMIFSRAPDDGLGITFRGLGTISRSSELEQSISLFQDGVSLAKGRLYTTSFFDVDRIEFIKGTQSSLLGKNSSLGAISVVDRQPGDTLSLEGSAGYEVVDGGYELDAAGDVPLGAKAAVRIAAHYNDLDGWVHNDLTNHDGPEQKDLGLRATLRAEPVETLTITAFYQYGENQQLGESMQLVGAIPAAYGDGLLDGHLTEYTSHSGNHETYHLTRPQLASAKGELQLGDHVLVGQVGYARYSLYFDDDLDFSKDDTVDFLRRELYSQWTEELRLQSPEGKPFEYMAGFFHLSSRWHSLETQLWAVPAFPPPPDPASGQLFNGAFANDFSENSEAYAGYASGSWRFAPRWRLSGGIRYSSEEKSIISARNAIGPLTIWNSIANPPFDPTPLSHHANFLDGNVSVQYALRPTVTAYASFGHGSKAGGFVETNTIAVPPQLLVNGKVPAALVAAGSALKDEAAKSYEIGLKTLWLDRRLRLNAALFLTDIHDFQDTVFTGGALGFITFNGPARSRGFEMDGAFQATSRLSLDAALTYADATDVIQPIDPLTNAPETNAAGDPVYGRYRRSQAPKLIVNGGAAYRMPLTDSLGVRLAARLHHRSSMYNQRQDMYLSRPLTTLDLVFGIDRADRRWSLDLAAKNVTNAVSEDFASAPPDPRFAAFYGAHGASPNRLRTIMLTAGFRY